MTEYFQDETHDIINDLRDEISKLREKIAAQSQPNKDDVLKMEVSYINKNRYWVKSSM